MNDNVDTKSYAILINVVIGAAVVEYLERIASILILGGGHYLNYVARSTFQ